MLDNAYAESGASFAAGFSYISILTGVFANRPLDLAQRVVVEAAARA